MRRLFFPGQALLLIIFITFHTLSSAAGSGRNSLELQKINKAEKQFSFLVFGDNRGSTDIFMSLIEKINKEDALFAIDIGDLVRSSEEKNFRFFLSQVSVLNKPLLTAIGNHDSQEGGRVTYRKIFGSFYYSFAVGNSYFIVLDNADGAGLNDQQMKWLGAELRKSRDYKNCFAFIHVPLYDPRRPGYSRGHSMQNLLLAKRLYKILNENKITMLFASHIHGFYRGNWGKIPYIITGGAGAHVSGSDPQHAIYHYIKVNVKKDGCSYEVVKIKGK